MLISYFQIIQVIRYHFVVQIIRLYLTCTSQMTFKITMLSFTPILLYLLAQHPDLMRLKPEHCHKGKNGNWW